MKKQQSGFTLIELISVIVILGILSAFALPRFANLEVQARAAAVEGLGGAMRSAAALAHAVWLANGATSGATVTITMEGDPVVVNQGWPDEANIASALLEDPANSGYVFQAPDTWTVAGVTNVGSCSVVYTHNAAAAPAITVNTSNCN